MRSLKISEVMWNHIEPIRCGTPLTKVVKALLDNHVTGLPVVDEKRQVLGFVSEQDCLRSILVSSYHAEGDPEVEDVMHTEPLTVVLDGSVVDVAEQMVKQKPKIYPVVDERRRLVGLLMRSQVLTALKNNRSNS